jgi:hypothetical protein
VETNDAIDKLVLLLDAEDDETANTSMRIPTGLRDAAALAVNELGAAPSTTAMMTSALRRHLDAVVMRAALESHYEKNPHARPTLAELAIAAVELDGHPLAKRPALLRQAAAEVAKRRPNATADDVILWAEATIARVA